jgi:hypothetical protein
LHHLLLQLLPGVCSVVGDCLHLHLNCSAAEPGSTWCEEGYLITVSDKQHTSHSKPHKPGSSSSSCHLRGYIWVLVDDSYNGMPATHMVSPGVPSVPSAEAPGQLDQANMVDSRQQQQQQSQGASLSDLLGKLQVTTVAVVLPSSFCSQDSSSSSSSNGSGGRSSAFSVLQSLLHELGHALHFLLSASAAADSAAAGGHQSSLEVMETTSHLVERMAHNAACLQVRR